MRMIAISLRPLVRTAALAGALAGALAWTAVAAAAPVGAVSGLVAAPMASVSVPAASSKGAEKYLAGLELLDQDGRRVDLYRDLVAGRTVVIHSFFAGCSASCPVSMAALKTVQERLGSRLGPQVRLVSITVAPLHDTPPALKAYARRMGAQAGWVFLTGSERQVGDALKRIGLFVDEPSAHLDIMIVGNMRTGLWKKIHGTAAGSEVVGLIMGVVDDGAR